MEYTRYEMLVKGIVSDLTTDNKFKLDLLLKLRDKAKNDSDLGYKNVLRLFDKSLFKCLLKDDVMVDMHHDDTKFLSWDGKKYHAKDKQCMVEHDIMSLGG